MQTPDAALHPFTYKRHQPEQTLLYQILAREWETWHAERRADESRSQLPNYIAQEIEAFFRCGILAHGFVILSCEGCSEKLPVAFSCKKRGLCPSCCAKRMSEISTHLIDNVLPHAPVRQWVTTFPHALRYWMAASRKLTAVVHRGISSMIQLYYCHKAQERGIKMPEAGGVTFVQRFGSALNLNVHFHTVAFDGVFSVAGPVPIFYQLPGPTEEELSDIVGAVASNVIKALQTAGYLSDDDTESFEPACLDSAFAESDQLAAAASASTAMRIAFGPRAGEKVRRIGRGFGYDNEIPFAKSRHCYSANGFTVHAGRIIGGNDRKNLEKLLAYGARGAFSHQRLSLKDQADENGDLIYTLKTQWGDGTEAILVTPSELIEKLIALIPPPYIHMSRYFGVLSSHSKWRSKIILKPHVKKGFVATGVGSGTTRMTWSKLLQRVFKIDLDRCPQCGKKFGPESCEVVTAPILIAAILQALGLDECAPARAPPRRLIYGLFADENVDQIGGLDD